MNVSTVRPTACAACMTCDARLALGITASTLCGRKKQGPRRLSSRPRGSQAGGSGCDDGFGCAADGGATYLDGPKVMPPVHQQHPGVWVVKDVAAGGLRMPQHAADEASAQQQRASPWQQDSESPAVGCFWWLEKHRRGLVPARRAACSGLVWTRRPALLRPASHACAGLIMIARQTFGTLAGSPTHAWHAPCRGTSARPNSQQTRTGSI